MTWASISLVSTRAMIDDNQDQLPVTMLTLSYFISILCNFLNDLLMASPGISTDRIDLIE